VWAAKDGQDFIELFGSFRPTRPVFRIALIVRLACAIHHNHLAGHPKAGLRFCIDFELCRFDMNSIGSSAKA